MSLEQLIEDDMVRFLESEVRTEKKEPAVRLEEAYHIRRDWENEIRFQLKRGDIGAAKRIFNELKEHYEGIPPAHAAVRSRNYELLQKCYLAIVSAAQDTVRTQVILQRLSQPQDDVFDVHIKPINLQSARHDAPMMPEPDAEQHTHDLALPTPPATDLSPQKSGLYTEDELVDALKPTLTKIKTAIHTHNRALFFEGVEALEGFAATLPPSNNRTLLERAAVALREKAHKGIDIVSRVRPYIENIRNAQQQKDSKAFASSLHALEEFATHLPSSVEKDQLRITVQQLRSQMPKEVLQ